MIDMLWILCFLFIIVWSFLVENFICRVYIFDSISGYLILIEFENMILELRFEWCSVCGNGFEI